jgi:ABC-type transport system involved in multi-copper enzyme maturation permease subunit
MFFNNPIFQREFKTMVRSPRTLLFITVYLLILAGILLLLWPSSGIQSVAAEGSKQIFSIFFSVNLTLVILLVPAFSATSITYEKENNTFAALFSTLLSPLNIATGKLLSSILILALLPILSLPIAATCALTGGVSFMLILKIMSVIILTTISYGLLGLACSSLSTRSSSSVLLNYIMILLIAGGSWLPSALLGNLLPSLRWLWQILRSASPYDILFNILMPGQYKVSMGVEQTLPPFLIFVIFSIIITAICFSIFYLKIVSPFSKKSKKQGDMYDGTKKSLKRKLSWPFYLFDPLKRKKLIGRFSNPVFVAETRRLYA